MGEAAPAAPFARALHFPPPGLALTAASSLPGTLAHADYGGHSSTFSSNIVYVNNGWNCVNIASFRTGHADAIFDNDCIITSQERVDDLFENCDAPSPGQAMMRGYNNRCVCRGARSAQLSTAPLTHPFTRCAALARFYTPLGNASANCDCCGRIPLSQLRKGVEDNFTSSKIPTAEFIVSLAKAKLGL